MKIIETYSPEETFHPGSATIISNSGNMVNTIASYLYGAGIGMLTWLIRTWGAYPDGLAFAVLLMNVSVPLLDRYTIPRIHGHARR